jgi:hypothetical protein
VAGGNEILEKIADKAEDLLYDATGCDENSINQKTYYVSAYIINDLAQLLQQLED